MKYAIKLHSKHTGEIIHLGSLYETQEEAEQYVEAEICKRCNSITIYSVPNNWVWKDRKTGFCDVKSAKLYAEEARQVERRKRELEKARLLPSVMRAEDYAEKIKYLERKMGIIEQQLERKIDVPKQRSKAK